MAVKTHTVPGIGQVKLYKRKKAKSIRISLQSDGSLRVSMPNYTPYAVALGFVEQKRDWITRNIKAREIFNDGHRIGKGHRLVFHPSSQHSTIATRVTSQSITISHPADMLSTDKQVQDAAEKASIRALKKQARNLLPQRVMQLANAHGFTLNEIKIKALKSRWGSCSSNKDITLSCFLMQLPWELIDYVILHELTHTKIMAHGKPFWNEMSKLHPNVKELRKRIKDYQPVLEGIAD